MCGELAPARSPVRVNIGSSPRVRGTQRPRADGGEHRRFIPACAGNSIRATSAPVASSGSSPRVRGTHCQIRGDIHDFRFIPACAGNSPPDGCQRPELPVHPRVCGELGSRWPTPGGAARFIPACAGNSRRFDGRSQLPSGSSPRVRGTRQGECRRPPAHRFIPACAGNSSARRGHRRRPPVHPRVCGELAAARRAPPNWRRFIPACAGNS